MKLPILAISLTLFLTACSTTGFSSNSNLIAPKTIKSPTSIPPEIAPYVPEFIDMLKAKGFAVGETNDPRSLVLYFEFNPNPFNLRVSAGLMQEGVPVLSASATNSGWGTALARGSAVNSLSESAVNTFKTELNKFMEHTKIVEDAPDKASDAKPTVQNILPTKSISDRLKELDALYKDGLISKAEYEAKRKEILSSM